MRTVRASLVAAAAVTLGGCNLDLTNPNQPTVASTLSNPRASISRMVVGVLATYRDNRAAQIRAVLHVHHGRAVHHGPVPRLETE